MLIRPLLIFIFLIVASACIAQDGHYWTQQYGTRSMLLSGSTVGGVDDLSTVFYNPGRLAVISNAAFLLSASVYEYNTLSVNNAFGDAKNVNQSSIRGVPTLAAGTFKIKQLPNHFFAYSILTRQNSDLNLAFRSEVHSDVIAAFPGEEYLGAEVSVDQNYQEQWMGLTWSHPLSESVSIGVTTNLTTSTRDKSGKVDLQALTQNNEVAIYRFNRGFTFKNTGLLWKAGLAWTTENWLTGVTVTTPYVSLSGSGSYRYEEFFSGAPGTVKPETYASSYQEGLTTANKTPFSVGLGLTRKIGPSKLHFSAEWFSAVPKYTAMRAVDHVNQSDPTDIISFNLVDEAKSVVNAGIGAEIYLSPKVFYFASFSTDFTAIPADISRFVERSSEASANGWNTDFYNVGTGIVLTLKGVDLTLGATHTGAKQNVPRPVNFPENSTQSIFSNTETAEVKWDRWRLVFSFSFPFLKDYADKLQGGKKDDRK